jgi:hypothetical protein
MKKLVLAGCVFTCAASVFAQGTIVFNNRVVGSVVAPVYGVDPANSTLQQSGNTANGFPVGTTTYGGAALVGTGFTAQLWGAPGANAPVTALVPATGYSTAPFRTGPAAAAGLWQTSTDAAVIPGAAEATVATLQVRAWDNQGGTITTWAAAVTAGTSMGQSALFNSAPLGGISPPPNLVGLLSFNLTGTAVPEPSTFALAGLGAVAMLAFRRRK